MQTISVEQSGAFIEIFTLPPTKDGPLRGLRFAVKDLIDVVGHPTGCGNPSWLTTHPPASVSAVCVEQLLAAGAQRRTIAASRDGVTRKRFIDNRRRAQFHIYSARSIRTGRSRRTPIARGANQSPSQNFCYANLRKVARATLQ